MTLNSRLDAQGQPLYRSGQAQPKPPQQHGTPYGQARPMQSSRGPYGGQPSGDVASWGSQQAAQLAMPGRQVQQLAPGHWTAVGAGEPQLMQPFTQTLNTPYGQMDPWQRAPGPRTPGSPMRPQGIFAKGTDPGYAAANPDTGPFQGTLQGGAFNYANWLSQGRPDSGQAAWQAQGSPKSMPRQSRQPYWQSMPSPSGQPTPGPYSPGQAQPIAPPSQGTPYGAPSPYSFAPLQPPQQSPAAPYGAQPPAAQPQQSGLKPPDWSKFYGEGGSFDRAGAAAAGMAYRAAKMASPEVQQWLNTLSPANRKLYSLMG